MTISRMAWQVATILIVFLNQFSIGCNTILEMAISGQKCRFVDSLTSKICYSILFLRLLKFSSMENSFWVLFKIHCLGLGFTKTIILTFRPKVDVWKINIEKWGWPLEVRGHMELDATATRTLKGWVICFYRCLINKKAQVD